MAKKILLAVLLTGLAGVVVVLYKACVPHTSRLDELVFHHGPGYRLKIVRYHQTLPLHYVGEVFRVMCQSSNTKEIPGHAFQDEGWRTLNNGGAIGSDSASDLLEIVTPAFEIVSENILAYQSGVALSFTFDACGSFRRWDPNLLPADLIAPPAENQRCITLGDGTCRYNLFEGDRSPRFDRIVAQSNGYISFSVVSEAFLRHDAYDVQSTDYGKTWTYR